MKIIVTVETPNGPEDIEVARLSELDTNYEKKRTIAIAALFQMGVIIPATKTIIPPFRIWHVQEVDDVPA